jgi:diguanylate cyclase (GGDEF)-like protein
MKILVADDDVSSRRILEVVLQGLGHDCHVVADGSDAWETYNSVQPDVVISDWMMPKMTGVELCRNIRAHAHGSSTYFIMVTSHSALDEITEGMNAGADDYLVKPLTPRELQTRLIAAARVTSLHHSLAAKRTELEGLNHELTAIARRDQLTALGNRLALDEDVELLHGRATRYGHRYCLALIDVDYFKSFNDNYGHPAGDQILRTVAVQLKCHARVGDAIYRYGGDEFLCILPEQSLVDGTSAVDRMRTGVEQLAIAHIGNPTRVLTISAGIAILGAGPIRPVSDVLRDADQALYQAKQLGRNRVAQSSNRSVG